MQVILTTHLIDFKIKSGFRGNDKLNMIINMDKALHIQTAKHHMISKLSFSQIFANYRLFTII